MTSRLTWKISQRKKSISNMLKPWNVMLTGGIICIMSILVFNSSCAKIAFSKQKVEGQLLSEGRWSCHGKVLRTQQDMKCMSVVRRYMRRRAQAEK